MKSTQKKFYRFGIRCTVHGDVTLMIRKCNEITYAFLSENAMIFIHFPANEIGKIVRLFLNESLPKIVD